MADLAPYSNSNSDIGDSDVVEPDYRSTGPPRWVKVFGIIAIVLVLLFITLHLTGRGLGSHASHSDYKPQGVTSYGRRKHREQRDVSQP